MVSGAQSKGLDISGGRLPKSQYALNFADLHPPLSAREALVEADRCFFCYEAPCQTACPTAIDIPLFIREIHNPSEATGMDLSFEDYLVDAVIQLGYAAAGPRRRRAL